MATLLKVPCPQATGSGIDGTKRMWTGDYFGNNSYQVGGDAANAKDFGLSGIEYCAVMGGRSASQTYLVQVIPPTGSSNVAEGVAPTYNNVTLKWSYAANSVEVANNTNLSTESLRVTLRGV